MSLGKDEGVADLPELDMVRVRRWADQQIPDHARDEIRIEVGVRGSFVTIFECRPPWHPDGDPEWTKLKTAQLRYDDDLEHWTLYWSDRNGRWHRYWDTEATNSVVPLLEEIDEDPTGIFWG